MSKKRGPNKSLATPPPVQAKKDAAKSPEKKSPPAEKPKRRFFGLFKRKEKWVLSWPGRLVVWGGLVVLGLIFILKVHPFLAVTDRVDAQYLVIEGWVPNYALEESIAEFKSKPYVKIFTVGADPLTGVNIEEGDSIAGECAARLKWMGMDMNLVQEVPARIKYRNRTFQSAVALREWAETNNVALKSFNLVTLGPHARRSRMLFEEAFKGEAKVGIISVEDREYDPKRWWKYSEGVKEMLGEGVGYVYARIFFRPD
jgi:hypothetical protein